MEEQLCYYQVSSPSHAPTISLTFEPGRNRILLRASLVSFRHSFNGPGGCWTRLLLGTMDGYKFVMQNYNVGDKVCLFGVFRTNLENGS